MVISPLTKNTNVSLVNSTESRQLIRDWIRTFDIDISSELAGCTKIDLYKCNKTGLAFFSPASVAGSEHLYAQLQSYDWFYMPWKWEHEQLFSRLDKSENILEVGCATGTFIEKLISLNFKVVGIELNTKAVEEATRKGLPVSDDSLSQLATKQEGAYDVICSFQVLEHIPYSAVFIEECLRLLKRGGRLVYSVPNIDSFLGYQYNLLDMPPHHMTRWNVSTFQALEGLYPIKLSCVRYEPLAKYHVEGYFQAHQKRLLEKNARYKLIINNFTKAIIKTALHRGIRHFFRGQSIYVEFTKQ